MTFDYYKTLKYNNVSHPSEEMNKICNLFDPRLHQTCSNIVKTELTMSITYDPSVNTTQEFCYYINYCDVPGPSKKFADMTFREALSKVSKTTHDAIDKVFGFFNDL